MTINKEIYIKRLSLFILKFKDCATINLIQLNNMPNPRK